MTVGKADKSVERLDRRMDLRGLLPGGISTAGLKVLVCEALGQGLGTKWVAAVERAGGEHVVSLYANSPGGVLHRLADLFDVAEGNNGWATREQLIVKGLATLTNGSMSCSTNGWNGSTVDNHWVDAEGRT